VEARKPLADGDVVDVLDVYFAALLGLGIDRGQVVIKLQEVTGIVAKRVFADVTLVSKVLEKLGK
jgi:hypothetical protein